MKKRNQIVVLVVFGLFILSVAGYFLFKKPEPPPVKPAENYFNGPCPGPTETYEMKDVYMRGVIEKGQKFKVIENYYACNPVKRGDIVVYRFSNSMDPVIKFARAVGGDKFKLQPDKEHQGWNLLVNGEMQKVDGKPYFFGAPSPPTLSLYIKARNGILNPGEVILLSSWPPGDSDSGIFGLANIRDLVGKVILKDSEGAVQSDASSEPTPATTKPSPTATPFPIATAKPAAATAAAAPTKIKTPQDKVKAKSKK